MTHDTMEPTPEFRDHLERTVVNALRLEQQLDNRKPAARTRWMGLAAIIVVSVALGATAGIASGQIRDSARRDSLLEAARADASLAAVRLDVVAVCDLQSFGQSRADGDDIAPSQSR